MKFPLFVSVILSGISAVAQTGSATPQQQQNISVVKNLYEQFNAHQWDKVAALYIDSAEFNNPNYGTEAVKQSHQDIIDKYSDMQAVSGNIKDSIVAIYPSGNKHVIVELVTSGTSDDDGLDWTLSTCTVFTFENGKITKDATYYNKPDE